MIVACTIAALLFLALLIGQVLRRLPDRDAPHRPPDVDLDSATPWSRWRRETDRTDSPRR